MEVFQFLMPIFTEYGYWAVFVMLLICGFGIPVPEDVTLVTGGVIAGTVLNSIRVEDPS